MAASHASAVSSTDVERSLLQNMSIVPKETIEVIAQSIGINNLSPDVALALAPDVEYRVREIMQEAIKCMRHSKRTILTADDVDSALNLRNVEVIVCLYNIIESIEKNNNDKNTPEIHNSLAGAIREWENQYLQGNATTKVEGEKLEGDGKAGFTLGSNIFRLRKSIWGTKIWLPTSLNATRIKSQPIYGFASGDPLRFKRAVGHKDLFYIDDKDVEFKDVVEAPLPKAPLDTAVMAHWLAIEGVQPAIPENAPVEAPVAPPDIKKSDHNKEDGLPVDIKLPVKHVLSRELQLYFDKFTELIVSRSDSNLFKDALMGLARDSGLHPLVPYFTHFIADETRVTRTLLNAFLDPKKAMTQHYGAIQGFAALGPSVVRLLVLPNLEPYLQLLEPEMLLEKQKNEVKRHEAWRVYGALLRAAGQCLYDRLKLFPDLLSPPASSVWRTNKRIVTMHGNKRKASNDLSSQQPPLKKVASDGRLGSISLSADMQGSMNSFPTMPSNSDMGPSSSSRAVSNEKTSGGGNRREKGSIGGQTPKTMSAVLTQAWKEDLDAGHLLGSLFELFGEGIFSFMQSPETSFFL
ncbi:hypothetical protein ACLOJK_000701 [Asimina triloba]